MLVAMLPVYLRAIVYRYLFPCQLSLDCYDKINEKIAEVILSRIICTLLISDYAPSHTFGFMYVE